MTDSHTSNLVDGYKCAFIDSRIESNPTYVPNLVSNSKGQKVLTTLESEMRECKSMKMSVAFITMGGIVPLLGVFNELEKKNTKAQIITTDYLMFSDPKALDRLNSLKNVEIKMYKTHESGVGFHTKGYLFHGEEDVRIMVGSSNLTQDAITSNHEWNTRIVSKEEGAYAKEIDAEFDNIWNSSFCYDYSSYRDEYIKYYSENEKSRKDLREVTNMLVSGYPKVLIPNSMQQEFAENLIRIIKRNTDGTKKALLVSATGTGKTYASAFASREILSKSLLSGKRILFVSHRQQINEQAKDSYARVFGKNVPMFSLAGSENVEDALYAQFVFSTIQTLSKDYVLNKFGKEYFTIIILDECHRAGAESYQKIIEYFRPELLLGMSASPDRTDGVDVYQLFDHNIACEIRLQQALENDLLCPFHYFGITDLQMGNGTFDDSINEHNKEDFERLTSDERIKHIIHWTSYYGYSGDKVKGLMFCRSRKEANELSRKLNEMYCPELGRNYRTIDLSGENNLDARQEAIERLILNGGEHCLDYILTVDIFNEGVDIPEINQVVMLRRTESPIIFVQQLGRGLRKAKDKEFVTVIDFIGNYSNNYMIPIALTGDRTGNKDNIRKGLMQGNNLIHGASTIYFDEISRKRIYNSIDSANINHRRYLKAEYTSLKNKLGRIPKLMDFDEYGELDPLRIISTMGSYYNFLVSYEADFKSRVSFEENEMLDFISSKFASGKRPHELEMLSIISRVATTSNHSSDDISLPFVVQTWKSRMLNKYNSHVSDLETQSVINVLSNDFYKNEYSTCVFIKKSEDNEYSIPKLFVNALNNPCFKEWFDDILRFGLHRNERDYSDPEEGSSFCLNQKYTYEDVCRLCCWEKNLNAQIIGGYKYDEHSKTYPVFINYEKEAEISDSINYHDRFETPSDLIALSKSNRSLQSNDVVTALKSDELGVRIDLFVRKNKNDKVAKDFYYLGQIKPTQKAEEIVMPNSNTKAVEIGYRLCKPVEKNLYDYITSDLS